MSGVNAVQVVTNQERRDWIGFQEAVGPPFMGGVMVHGPIKEIRPREGFLNMWQSLRSIVLIKDVL